MSLTYPLILPPQGIRSITLRPRNVVAMSTSPFTGQQQVQSHPGQWWEGEINFPPMKQSGLADDMAAFITALRGQYGTFLLGDSARKTPRGVATGAAGAIPYIDGASQTGMELALGGLPVSTENVFRAGDYIQLGGTNLLTRAREPEHANWIKLNASVTAYATPWVLPSFNAGYIEATGSGSIRHYIYQSIASAEESVPYTASVYVKTRTSPYFWIAEGAGGAWQEAVADLSNGAITASANLISSSIVSLGSGWYRVSITFRRDSSSSIAVFMGPTSSATHLQGAAVGYSQSGQSVYACGAQVNKGYDPDGYVRTDAAAITNRVRLHKVLADVRSDSNGDAVVQVWPPLRESPTNTDGIKTTNPRGTFRLASNDIGWDVDVAKTYGISIPFVEAI